MVKLMYLVRKLLESKLSNASPYVTIIMSACIMTRRYQNKLSLSFYNSFAFTEAAP